MSDNLKLVSLSEQPDRNAGPGVSALRCQRLVRDGLLEVNLDVLPQLRVLHPVAAGAALRQLHSLARAGFGVPAGDLEKRGLKLRLGCMDYLAAALEEVPATFSGGCLREAIERACRQAKTLSRQQPAEKMSRPFYKKPGELHSIRWLGVVAAVPQWRRGRCSGA
jgi:hypothetical protein